MGADVGVFQVANAPTYGYVYTLPFLAWPIRLSMFSILFLKQRLMCVVYFYPQTGASHSVHWLKSPFWHFTSFPLKIKITVGKTSKNVLKYNQKMTFSCFRTSFVNLSQSVKHLKDWSVGQDSPILKLSYLGL